MNKFPKPEFQIVSKPTFAPTKEYQRFPCVFIFVKGIISFLIKRTVPFPPKTQHLAPKISVHTRTHGLTCLQGTVHLFP